MKLLAYLRYSPRPVVKWTLEKQREEITEWAAPHGHVIVAEYTDRSVSGDDNNGNVARQTLVDALREGDAEGVVFADFSRWTRQEAIPALYFIDQLEREGIRVLSAWEDFLNQPSGIRAIALLIVLSKNEMELKRMRGNISKGVRLARKSGIWMGPVPLFYRRLGSLADEPDGKPVDGVSYWIECFDPSRVQALFEGRRDGKSLATLAAEVGIRRDQVSRVLAFRENMKIVGEDLWLLAQQVASTQRRSKWYRSYLLTGLVVCPFCDRRLSARLRTRISADGTVMYRCPNDSVPHAWRNISQHRILGHLLKFFDGLDLDGPTRNEIQLLLNKPLERVRLTEREKRMAEIARQRSFLEGAKKRERLSDEMVAKNMAELDRLERLIPPEVAESARAEQRPLDLMCSLGAAIRRVGVQDYRAIQAANALLREVVISITFADDDRDHPVFRLKPEMRLVYETLRSKYPVTIATITPSEPTVIDPVSQALLVERREKDRQWRASPSGQAATRASGRRYQAKLTAIRRALQEAAIDKRYTT
jgi:Site-specific recombinases, DNA invertase Pin homologs